MAASNNESRPMQQDDEHKQSKGQQHQDSGHGKSSGGQQGGQGAQKTDHREKTADERVNVGQSGRQGNQAK